MRRLAVYVPHRHDAAAGRMVPVKHEPVKDRPRLREMLKALRKQANVWLWKMREADKARWNAYQLAVMDEAAAVGLKLRSRLPTPTAGQSSTPGTFFLAGVTQDQWNDLMDALPRCECGRPVYPPHAAYQRPNSESALDYCSERCKIRAGRRSQEQRTTGRIERGEPVMTSRAREEAKRRVVADDIYQSGVE